MPESPALPARVTVPAAEAFTALPMGLPMSMPACSLPSRVPYGEVMRPLTGQPNEAPP